MPDPVMRNKRILLKTLIAALFAFGISPLFNIHIHHEISGAVGKIINNDLIEYDNCEDHKEHGCSAESLLDHLFEHGVIAGAERSGISEGDSLHFDGINGIIAVNTAFTPESIQYIAINEYGLIVYLLSSSENPRSPPINS
jgi:hypothetical protein